jgi:Protein of unknown function (DUF3093)
MATMTAYRERLRVAWWVWPASLAAAAFVATELAIGAYALRSPVTYGVALALALLGVLAMNRVTLAVEGAELRVDDARLPLSVISSVTVLDAESKRNLLGIDAEPLAFVIQRPWIPRGVRIDLNDPDDPTPYWYISSRHPRELAAALGFPPD